MVAALLLADVAFSTGMYVQGFPEYGPERMGAPITAYNRLSNKQIRVHSNIYDPDYVVVVDETLLDSVDVTEGLKEEGAIIINTKHVKEELLPKLNGYKGRVYTIDARKISLEALGKYFPNSPMLAAIVKVSGVMDDEAFLAEMQKSYAHKFASKPEVIEGNMKALSVALQEVQCCATIAVRNVLRGLHEEDEAVITCATGCLEVSSFMYPYTAWKDSFIHNAFENAGATCSGVEAAYRALKKKGKVKKHS